MFTCAHVIGSSPTSGGGFAGPTGYLWVWK
jgi:hypothetical protein